MTNSLNFIKNLLLVFLITFSFTAFSNNAHAATNNFTVTFTADKANVKPGEAFSLSIDVKNTGTTAISNLEVRVPFNRNINDATYQVESPSFNKILDSIEYPAGFNSRSWIINTLDPSENKTFTLKYQVSADPKTPNGLVSSFTLPISWVDPAGAQSNTAVSLNTFRADVYINKAYNTSYTVTLPKLASLDNQVALVNLNTKYLASGSKTTNLKSITSTNISSFPNFILDSADMTIEWLAPIDFSATNTSSQLSALDTSLATASSKLTFNATNLPFLANKPVRITFKSQNFVSSPKIKVGENVTELTEAKATFNQTAKTVSIELPALANVAIVPNITLDKSVIETSVEDVEIIGTVADPNSTVTYTIDNSSPQPIVGIDLATGKFTIPVNIKSGTKQIEITTKLKNNETISKIVVVRFTTEQKSDETRPTDAPSTISIPINQITIALLLAAVGLLAIIAGVIYYLVKQRKKNNKTQINLNPVVNKVSRIGINKEEDFPINTPKEKTNSEKIDLSQLSKKYENKTPEKPIVENTSKPQEDKKKEV